MTITPSLGWVRCSSGYGLKIFSNAATTLAPFWVCMSELCLSKVSRLDYGNIQIWDLKGYLSLFHALLFWYVLRSLIWVKSDFILFFAIMKFHVKAKKKGEDKKKKKMIRFAKILLVWSWFCRGFTSIRYVRLS